MLRWEKVTELGYYDGRGFYRSRGEGGYDARGIYRSPGDGGYDAQGFFRSAGEGGYDYRGYFRSAGEAVTMQEVITVTALRVGRRFVKFERGHIMATVIDIIE